jgi:hypothetical protein
MNKIDRSKPSSDVDEFRHFLKPAMFSGCGKRKGERKACTKWVYADVYGELYNKGCAKAQINKEVALRWQRNLKLINTTPKS